MTHNELKTAQELRATLTVVETRIKGLPDTVRSEDDVDRVMAQATTILAQVGHAVQKHRRANLAAHKLIME